MLLPILGFFALFALTSCSRSDDKIKKSVPCPPDWQDQEIVVDQKQLRICQKDSDQFGLTVGDRFVRAGENDFKIYQEKFRLPNFEGLQLKNWLSEHRQVFPLGASIQEEERFQSLQSYFQERKLSMENALSMAQKISWLDNNRFLRAWKTISPQDKMDSLALLGILMSAQDLNGFQEFRRTNDFEDNKRFVDTVLNKIGAGKLSLARQAQFKGQGFNALSETVGLDNSALYSWNNDVLLLGLPIDPNSLVSSSNYLHELSHFYQDSMQLNSNFLEGDFAAYAKQGEFVVSSLQDPIFQKKYSGTEDYLQKEYLQKGHSIDEPIPCGIRYAQAILENNEEFIEKRRSELLESINIYHYFQPLLIKNYQEFGKKALNMTNTVLALSKENQEEALKRMDAQIQNMQLLKIQAFKALEDYLQRLEAHPVEEESQFKELSGRFQLPILLSALLIQLAGYRDRIAAGNLEPITQSYVHWNDPDFQKLYHNMAKYQPLKYRPVKMDGVN